MTAVTVVTVMPFMTDTCRLFNKVTLTCQMPQLLNLRTMLADGTAAVLFF